jgi:hypothetical protein
LICSQGIGMFVIPEVVYMLERVCFRVIHITGTFLSLIRLLSQLNEV